MARKRKNPPSDYVAGLVVAGITVGAAILLWPKSASSTILEPMQQPNMPLPPSQPTNAGETGTAILARTTGMSQAAREAEFIRLARIGNSPSWMWQPVEVAPNLHVTPDFLSLGTDADHIWVPLTPAGAIAVLRDRGMRLPTRHEAEQIYAAASHVAFQGFTPEHGQTRWGNLALGVTREKIVRAIGEKTGLIDGHKKYVLGATNGHVIIVGGHYGDGSQVQPYSTIHDASYLDYSHGIRGVVA